MEETWGMINCHGAAVQQNAIDDVRHSNTCEIQQAHVTRSRFIYACVYIERECLSLVQSSLILSPGVYKCVCVCVCV